VTRCLVIERPAVPKGERCPVKGPTETVSWSRARSENETGPAWTAERDETLACLCLRRWPREAIDRSRKMGSFLQQIAQLDNLSAAFAKVKANKGAAGIDRISVAAFETNLERELASLRKRLLSDERYQPPPVRRVEIAKPGGGSRPLGIPTVGDRVVQQATLQVIGPLFEEVFEDCSFGFRPGRGPKAALAKVREHIAQGDRWVAEFDIKGFFDNLSHRRLIRWFAKVVDDPEVVGLVRRWLKAGVVTADGLSRSVAGTPQGGVMTPPTQKITRGRI